MRQQFIALLKPLAIIEVVILIAVGVVCYASGWRTLNQYFTALLFVGVFIFAVGPFSLSISSQNRILPENTRLFHMGTMDQVIQRSREGRPQISSSLPRFTQLLMIAGAFNFGVGLVLQALVK